MTNNYEQDLEGLLSLAYIDTWEPYIVEGQTVGTVHWLNYSEPDEPFILTGVWKHIPEDHSNNEFYCCYGNNDMMFYVLEGEAEFCTSDGKTTSIRKSDKFFFPKGSKDTWQTLTPFATLFVQTNSFQKDDNPDSLSFRTLTKQLENHKTAIKYLNIQNYNTQD